jgi:hypothetical protein
MRTTSLWREFGPGPKAHAAIVSAVVTSELQAVWRCARGSRSVNPPRGVELLTFFKTADILPFRFYARCQRLSRLFTKQFYLWSLRP